MLPQEIVFKEICKLAELRCASIFKKPVDRTLYPNYDQVISRPIDLGKILSNLVNEKY